MSFNYGMDYQGGGTSGGRPSIGSTGGGFGGAGSSHGSQSVNRSGGGGSGSRRSYDEQTLQPVTIRMALNALTDVSADGHGGGSLQLQDGRRLYHVKIVGAVRMHEDNSTNTVFHIEDGTGLIEAKQWVDNNDCTAKVEMQMKAKQDHIYVKVIGQLKDYEGRKSIVAESVRPVSSGNELTHHMLEVVYAAEQWRRQANASSTTTAPMMISPPQATRPQGGGGLARNNAGGSGGVRDFVLSFIRDEGEQSETGVKVDACIKHLYGRFSADAIRHAINDLAVEGHIYSTINEEHFKSSS